MKKTFKLLITALAVIAITVIPAMAEKKVKIAYVEWACATASANVAKAVIETKLGHKVELTPVSAPAMYQALASGDQDAITTAWLPVTHGDMVKKFQDKIVDLGPNLEGAKIGLVVPSYVTIDSLDQLNAEAKKFKGKIIGIDPGAGIMKKTENAINEYGLKDMELVSSSGAGMTATLASEIKNKNWVIVTGWTPHWMFAAYDLKYLKDPKAVFGEAETINTMTRKGLDKDMPDVYKFLDSFRWTTADIGEVMNMNKESGSDVEANALKWVKDHSEKVNEWLK